MGTSLAGFLDRIPEANERRVDHLQEEILPVPREEAVPNLVGCVPAQFSVRLMQVGLGVCGDTGILCRMP